MKILYTIIILLFISSSVFAVHSISAKSCDKITLTDGRVLDITITRVTDDRIFFVSCDAQESETERVYYTKFISSVYLSHSLETIELKNLNQKFSVKSKTQAQYSKSAKQAISVMLVIAGTIIGVIAFAIHQIYKAISNWCFMC